MKDLATLLEIFLPPSIVQVLLSVFPQPHFCFGLCCPANSIEFFRLYKMRREKQQKALMRLCAPSGAGPVLGNGGFSFSISRSDRRASQTGCFWEFALYLDHEFLILFFFLKISGWLFCIVCIDPTLSCFKLLNLTIHFLDSFTSQRPYPEGVVSCSSSWDWLFSEPASWLAFNCFPEWDQTSFGHYLF